MSEFSQKDASRSTGEVVLYNTDDGRAQVQLRLVEGTVWLTQAEMAELFDYTPQNITQHIANIYDEREHSAEATCKDFFQVRQEGSRLVKRQVKHYNLDMILAVGYRVRSPRGVQFRQWATTVLSEYLVKGFAMNDERLKEPGGLDYFDELLERIRDIRASEKRFYQKIQDIFTTSVDYDSASEAARTFFSTIQNKLCYAVTGKTAAEMIVKRADAATPNMGLTSFKGSVVRKVDITTAKNYLTQDERSTLNLLVTQFLDFAELRARRRHTLTMADWITQTDRFLTLNDFELLDNAGTVSNANMKKVVAARYEVFDKRRRELEAQLAEVEAEEDAKTLLAGEDLEVFSELEQRQKRAEENRP